MKSRILIVEDNVTLSQMQKDWLTREGYEVTTAIDAAVARRLIRKADFDLILSDVRLPEGGWPVITCMAEEREAGHSGCHYDGIRFVSRCRQSHKDGRERLSAKACTP